MSFTVAVTRPEPQATQTASRLAARGYRVVRAPLLVAHDVGDWGPAHDIGALAITSRTAAMRLADHPAFHGIPTFCVGRASAAGAAASGAREVESANGDVEALLLLLRRKARPPVVHLSGEDQRGDLAGRLSAEGIPAERRIIYRMGAAEALPVLDGPLDATLLYSPRTARIYAGLATLPPWREAACVALSQAVANNLCEGPPVVTAERPDEDALFDALDRLRIDGF